MNDQNEVWTTINDFPNYEVSSLGNVRNIDTKELRKAQLNHRGFPTLTLYNSPDPSRYVRQVNKLVAEHFCTPPRYSNENAVWHIDGDLTNCHASNLKWDLRPRVLEWNDMCRDGTPKLKTPRILHNASGRIFDSAFEVGLFVGDTETSVVRHIENYPPHYADRARYRYV